eukprot:10041835-Alexandrium_andersonii.AAC.1
MLNDPEHWRPEGSEAKQRAAEAVREMHEQLKKKGSTGLPKQADAWHGKELPYAYATIKAKCHSTGGPR